MNNKETIYILGGGIIGCTTAFYLTKHTKFDPEKHQITIIESNDIACAASGKAGGLLASWAFPTKLSELSFKLHQDLAQLYQGDINWDYRHVNTVNLDIDLTNDENESENENESRTATKNSINLPINLNWIDPKFVTNWTQLSDEDSTAQVHPYKFTKFILKKAMETQCVDVIYGKVEKINVSEQTKENNKTIRSLEYIPVVKDKKAEKNKDPQSNNSTSLETEVSQSSNMPKKTIVLSPQDKVIVCMGPWTPTLLRQCPISGLRAHSITVDPLDYKIEPYALFNEIKLNPVDVFTPEIYARKHDIYICGEGDNQMRLPDPMTDVDVSQIECDKLYKYASILSPNIIGKGQIMKRQACYLPVLNVATSSGPLIGETDVNRLYMASGHSCWGINNSCATGKVMSEIIFDGKATSCDVDKLDPKLYFSVN